MPGSRFAVGANIPHPHKASHADQVRLRDFLDQVRDDYDIVLIDCPPNLHMASWAAMAASDAFIVPVQPEDFGAQGTQDVIESAAGVRAVVNPSLALAGYVVSMYQAPPRRPSGVRRAPESQPRRRRIRGGDPDGVGVRRGSHRPHAGRVPQAKGAAAKAIRTVAEELAARLGGSHRQIQAQGRPRDGQAR